MAKLNVDDVVIIAETDIMLGPMAGLRRQVGGQRTQHWLNGVYTMIHVQRTCMYAVHVS